MNQYDMDDDNDGKIDDYDLIELEKPIGFVRFMKLENALSQLIGVRVELVTKKALKPR